MQITLERLAGPVFEHAARLALGGLLLVLLGALLAGVSRAALDLWHGLPAILSGTPLHEALHELLIDALTVLAMVEVFRTALAYLVHGRVKVTYLIDTVLVALLTEVLAFWYRDFEPAKLLLVMGLVLGLMGARILAIRFSPNRRELCDGL